MTSDTRWVGGGRSVAHDAATAARDAVAAALQGRSAKLVLMFASVAFDLDALVRHAYELAGGATLIGCSTAGEIANGGPSDASVVTLALGGAGFRVAGCSVGNIAQTPREAGAEAARLLGQVGAQPHHVLMLLTDGLVPVRQELVRGAYAVAGGGVALVGGGAGDQRMAATYQFFNGEVLRGAMVAVAIGSDAPLGVGVRHGCTPVGEPMLVTDAGTARIRTLDDRPALDNYLDRLNAPAAARQSRQGFSSFAAKHPLGTVSRTGEGQVRWVAEADFERREIVTINDVPPGTLIWAMRTDERSTLAATQAACADALSALEGAQPRGIVVFDCVARREVLGDEGIRAEVEQLERQVGGAPVAGFYTYGEIARTRGVIGSRSQTLVVLALA